MIKQEIFNDQAMELANYIMLSGNEWKNFEEFLRNGGKPFEHICFSACVVMDLIEEDFLSAVEKFSSDEFKNMVHDFIVNEMGE